MNKKTRFNFKKLILIIGLIFFMYLVGLKYISSHEYIHRSIFNRYNIYSETTITPLLNGLTIPDTEAYKLNCTENCKSLSVYNDIIGYYLTIFCMFIFVLYCFKKL